VNCAKTADPIEMQFGILSRMGPGNMYYKGMQMSTWEAVLLRYPKPTPKPRFFAKTVRRRNLGFSAIIDGFWAHLHAKII